MLKKIPLLIILGICTLVLNSCANDDDGYISLNIKTNTDSVSVAQGNTIVIDVLLNDENLPEDGFMSFTQPQYGEVVILDNNTPNYLLDDTLEFTANTDYYGEVSFDYTVCDTNNNCSTTNVIIEITPVSPVNFNLDEIPYENLADYNFFEGTLKNLEPVYGVLPYDMISPLFSDYAQKKRFIWMPNGSSANYVGDHDIFDFPVGTILIKNFFYDTVLPDNTTKIIETRLMILKNDGWIFANYVWNEDQTEAVFDLSGSYVEFEFIENEQTKNINYRIPSHAECLTCHKSSDGTALPIGPKPQNINKVITYENGEQNQLDKWIQIGYLNNAPSNINSVINWEDESYSMELRVRSYLDINCAHCHSDDRHCDYRPIRFAFNQTQDLTNLGVCVEPHTNIDDALTYIVTPGNSERSVISRRISSIDPSIRMPLLARTLQHTEAVSLIEDWINSLDIICE